MTGIWKIIRLAKPFHWLMVTIGLLTVVNSALQLVTPILLGQIVDTVVAVIADNSEYGGVGQLFNKFLAPDNWGQGLGRIGLLLGLSFLAVSVYLVLSSISQRLGDHLAANIRKLLTEKFYQKALYLPQSYYEQETSGKVLNQLNRGVSTIENFTNTASNFIFPTILQAVLTIAVVAYYSIPIALLLMAIYPIYVSLSAFSSKRWGKREEVKNKIEDTLRGRIMEVVANIKLVRGYNREKLEQDFATEKLDNINSIYAKQSNEFHLLDFLREFSLYVIIFSTIVLVINDALLGAISVGTVLVLIQFIDRVRMSMFGMSYMIGQFQRAESGSKEYLEVLALDSLPEDNTADSDLVRLEDPIIEFKNVDFSYQDSEEVLTSLDVKFGPRETVAIVGPSGAGKSTIINLILKFYKPTKGEILLSGKNYSQLTAKEIRNNIALVFQETELFSTTIYENVAYGIEATRNEVVEALKKANAWEFVEKLSKGIDSAIGERGVRLSGGQRQRIQIARAMLKDAPILLLDEATSSLDAKSEREVQVAIDRLKQKKLVLIVAHRFSTIQNADRVVVLSDHKVADQGTPAELAARPGIYADLLKYQLEGNKSMLKKFDIAQQAA